MSSANSSKQALPVLPNELLRMIVLNFQWMDDFDDMSYAWTELRCVSHMFKDTVEHFFRARHLPATVIKPDDGGEFLFLAP